MPTFDSENQVITSKQQRPFARVAKDGKLVPEVVQVIGIIAKHNLVLETGHSSPTEALMLIREARAQGVQNILVTHAMSDPVRMSIAEMQEAAKLGAYLELVWVRPGSDAAQAYVKAIRAVGPQYIVLSSDLGQATTPLHPDGLLAMYQYLQSQGISEAEIDRMAKTNPAKLLGLN
jgi:predicted metal-dependent TIM-barrel fold hydrolase